MNDQAQAAMVLAWGQAIAAAWPQQSRGGEYEAIQRFMYDEMRDNANSGTVIALKLLAMTEGDNEFTPVPGQAGRMRYDFWSNLHYGYVGIEAGFEEYELRVGAHLADVGTRGQTDPGDDLAIRMGIELRAKYGSGDLQPHHVEDAIRQHRAELEQTGMVIP